MEAPKKPNKLRNLTIVGSIGALLTGAQVKEYGVSGILPTPVKEAIYYSVDPYHYKDEIWQDDLIGKFKYRLKQFGHTKDTREHFILSGVDSDSEKRDKMNRLDAWRIYLGLPQLYNTFSISTYSPRISSENRKYFKINGFIENMLNHNIDVDGYYYFRVKTSSEIIKYFHDIINEEKNPNRGEHFIVRQDAENGIMNRYKVSLGKDERGDYISYYDRWDLKGNPVEGKNGTFGKPFEIYDRFYFDKETFEILE